jgi:hypothetical protein
MPVKTKADLVMIRKLVRKYCYIRKVYSAMLSPGGIKSLGSLQQSIQMEQSRFNVENVERMNVRRVKPFIEDLDNKNKIK